MDPKASTLKMQQAYLVELSEDEDIDTDDTSACADTLQLEPTNEKSETPVAIDIKSNTPGKSEKHRAAYESTRANKHKDDSQVACFTCFLGPCPEVVNANFKHSEFMICYRDAKSRCENGMMRYYCCPLYLATIKKNGEETYELRAVQTESNLQSNEFNNHNGGGAAGGTRMNHEWHSFYNNTQAHPNLGAGMSHHSFSNHHFNCRQLPPQFNFLHHCSCACPPQMMAYYLSNYRYQQQQLSPHGQASQQGFRQFGYHPGYMFPSPGSAMS